MNSLLMRMRIFAVLAGLIFLVVMPVPAANVELLVLSPLDKIATVDTTTYEFQWQTPGSTIDLPLIGGLSTTHFVFMTPVGQERPLEVTFSVTLYVAGEELRSVTPEGRITVYPVGPEWVKHWEITESNLDFVTGGHVTIELTVKGTWTSPYPPPWSPYVEISYFDLLKITNNHVGFNPIIPEPYSIEHIYSTSIDHWFRLNKTVINPEHKNGDIVDFWTVTSKEFLPYETVEFEGQGIEFEPSSNITDDAGAVGVKAYIDMEDFYGMRSDPLTKEMKLSPEGVKLRNLRIKYKKLVKEHGITGNFCQIIWLDGAAWVNNDHAAVVGEILAPGTRLDLRAEVGMITKIGLRFVNGTTMMPMQDVYTNYCEYDTIIIGGDGFQDQSLIKSGSGYLGSVTKYLCDKIGDLPNTPDKWEKAVGKFIVTSLASSVVPGSGVGTYIIKYAVQQGAGEAYDRVVEHKGSKAAKESDAIQSRTAVPPPRTDISFYYDGSMRLTQTDGSFTVWDGTMTNVVSTVDVGQWREILPNGSPGRVFEETPDTIDNEGPEIKIGVWLNPVTPTIANIDIWGFDIADVDAASFHVFKNSQDITSLCSSPAAGRWTCYDISPFYMTDTISVTLSDTLGNSSSLVWRFAELPAAPGVTIQPGTIGGSTPVSLAPPPGVAWENIRGFQVRQVGGGGSSRGDWQDTGRTTATLVAVLPDTRPTFTYAIEARTVLNDGLIGFEQRSNLVNVEPPGPRAISDHILQKRAFSIFELQYFDVNKDYFIDVGDVIKRVNDENE